MTTDQPLDRDGVPIDDLDIATCHTCRGHTLVHSADGLPWIASDPDTVVTEHDQPVQCPGCRGHGHTA